MTQTDPNNSSHPCHDSQALSAWLTLAHSPGMSSRLFNHLLETFHAPDAILASGKPRLLEAGVSRELAEVIARAGTGKGPDASRRAVDDCLLWQAQDRHHIVTRGAPDYPSLLLAIPDPPPLLYIKGNMDCLHLPMIAMVGSRRPSADGRRHARRFAREFAEGGIGVSSGLALGIDAESHRGALQGNGTTVAVLGTGIDRKYPAANAALFDQIADQGALVSEFNPGTEPFAGNFPKRNRIISGLSIGVLVVEAGMKSGSMITARFALEQGRDVFAIPGSINNPMARGCHQLIANGARLVQSAADVVAESGAMLGNYTQGRDAAAEPAQVSADKALSREERKLKDAIGYEPVPLDSLLLDTGMEVSTASIILVELEMRGVVRREPGGYVLAAPD